MLLFYDEVRHGWAIAAALNPSDMIAFSSSTNNLPGERDQSAPRTD